MMFCFKSILQIWITLIGFRDTIEFVNLGICKHEFKFTCRGYCRFTLTTHISSGFETLVNIFTIMIPTLPGPQKRKASMEDDAQSNEPMQKYSRTNVKSGNISTCTITKPVAEIEVASQIATRTNV